MMLRLLTIAALCLGLLAVSACQKDTENDAPPVGFRGNARPLPTPRTSTADTTHLPPTSDSQMANATPPPPPAPTASAPAQPAARDVPYGIPVQGKAGFVVSPYAPESGQIDVRGFAPGQEALDPLTNKVFLVP